MKNLYRNMLLVAAAAMSFASCSKDAVEETVNPEVPMMELAINAQIDDTRVTLNGDRTGFQWSAWASEKVGIFTNVADTQYETSSYKENSTEFTVSVPADATEVYAYYPLYSSNSSKTNVSLYIANAQKQAEPGVLQGTNAKDVDATSGSGQFPMVASGKIENGAVTLSFRPVACALALNIYDTDANRPTEKVTKVSFEPKGNINNYGSQYIDLTQKANDETFVYEGGKSGAITVTLGTPAEIAATKPDTKTNPQQVYICTARVDYTQGGTITVTTDAGNIYTFDITANIPCANCDLLPISLNLKNVRPEPATGTFVKISSMTDLTNGEYVLAGVNNGTYYALPASPASDKIAGVEIAVAEDKIAGADATGKIWTIKKEGDYYSLYNETTYLYHATGGSDGTKLATGTKQEFPWNITFENGEFKFAGVTTKVNGRGLLFQTNTSNQFGGYSLTNYGSTGYSGITLFKKIDPNAPKLTITSENSLTVGTDGKVNNGAPTITYEITNPKADWTVTASVPTEDQSWITLDTSVNGKIALDVQSNNGPARSTTVTVTYGDLSETVMVKQEGTVIVPGKSYSYTFTSKVFSANGTKTLLGELPWTLAGDGNYFGAVDDAKGQQLGSKSSPYKNMTLTLSQSDYSIYSPDSQAVQTVKVNTCGGSSVSATLTVSVGGVQVGESVTLTNSATEYTFTADALLSGDVVLTYTQTSNKAIYIKSISINQ